MWTRNFKQSMISTSTLLEVSRVGDEKFTVNVPNSISIKARERRIKGGLPGRNNI